MPVGSDGGGNMFFLSLPSGTMMKWRHEIFSSPFIVIAPSFVAFLDRIAQDWVRFVDGDSNWDYLAGYRINDAQLAVAPAVNRCFHASQGLHLFASRFTRVNLRRWTAQAQMSYDLQLLPRNRVDELLRQYEAQEPDSLEINPGAPIPEREEWKRRVRDALVTHEPRFSTFPFGFAEIAKMEGITESEARDRYRHLELNLPDDDPTGIQVTIFDETVAVNIAYWHSDEAAKSVFREVWSYLEVLEQAGDLVTHDPQIGRILNPASDFEEVLSRYLGVVKRIPEILAETQESKKPWWKFW